MEYFGTIFVAVICFVLGYVLGRLKERKVYKSIENEWLEDRDGCFRDGVEEGKALAEKDLGWHSVEESLPPIDEEVIVLVAPLEVYSSPMKICFGHRPNPDGWDAISTLTGRKKHYTPETYDGWNIPGVRFWMPLPKLEEEK